MLTRTRLALAGLAVAGAATGLAATGGSAVAHPAPTTRATRTVAARAHVPTVTIEVRKKTLALSHRVTPGVTTFDVRRDGAGGGIEILSLRHGYTLADLGQDFGKLFSGDVKAIRRVDRSVVFHGGVPTPTAKGDAASFAIRLHRGTYHVVNFDKGTSSTLHVRGHRHGGALPQAGSRLDYVGEMRFSRTHVLHDGWISITNRTDEPHFTSLDKVKRSTTRRQVRRFLSGGAQGQPSFGLAEHHDALPLSPGQTMLWRSRASHGRYVALCFWPSDEDGMPHALMGMWRLLSLR